MKILKKLMGFSLGPILGAIFSAISVPITTYYLFPNEYGKTSMFNMMYSILLMVAYMGYDQAYIREYHEYEDKSKVLFNSMIVPIFATVVLIIITVCFAPYISMFLFESVYYKHVVYMFASILPFLMLERFILVNLRMQEKALEYSFFSLFVKLVAFLCTLVFLINIRRDFLAIVYSTLISHYIGDGILIFLFRKMLRFNRNMLDKKLIKTMTGFALPLIPATIAGSVFNAEDKIFIKLLSNYDELGYYQVSMTLAGMVLILQQAFSTFWTPMAYRWKNENVPNEKYEYVQKTICFISSACFMGILLIKNIFPVILSEKYSATKYILPFLLFYPVMSMMLTTTTIGIDFARKTYYSMYFSIAVVIFNFFMNLIFVPLCGAKGAAIATGMSHVFYFAIKTYYSRKLWFDFEIRHFVNTIVILSLSALINSLDFIPNNVVYMCDVILILIGIFCYKDYLIETVNLVKYSRKKDRII